MHEMKHELECETCREAHSAKEIVRVYMLKKTHSKELFSTKSKTSVSIDENIYAYLGRQQK